MRDTPTTLDREGWRQRYRNSYGFLVNKDETKTLCYINDVTQTEVRFTTPQGGGFFAYHDRGIVFEFLPITRGWFFTTTYGWVLLTRVPARQWNRGICETNTRVDHLDKRGKFTQIPLTLEILEDVFIKKPKAPSGSSNGVVFLITADTVYFYSQKVGSVKEQTITLFSELVRQELSDFIRRQGFTYKVEVNE